MTDKITIKGTAPKFDEAVLKQRQAARHNQYHLTSESYEIARGTIAFEFLTNVIKLVDLGYELSNKYPVTTDPMSYQAYMRKPDAIQQVEKQALDAQVKLDYIADLEREREEYRVKLTAQLLQTHELQEAKKAADKQAKVLAEIGAEVAATFGELIVPE